MNLDTSRTLPASGPMTFSELVQRNLDLSNLMDLRSQLEMQLDQYFRLLDLQHTITKFKDTETFRKNIKATLPGMEANIFTITKAIVKAIYNAARFVLRIVGSAIRFVSQFFKRNLNDAKGVINNIAPTIPLCANEVITLGMTKGELDRLRTVMDAHLKAKDRTPETTTGMTIDAYKTLFFKTFNAGLPQEAQVDARGRLLHSINYTKNARLSYLGWRDQTSFAAGIDDLLHMQESVKGILTSIREQSGEMRKIVSYCEANGNVQNNLLQDRGPHTIDVACLCVILVNDMKILKKTEDVFTRMITSVEKASHNYVQAKNPPNEE